MAGLVQHRYGHLLWRVFNPHGCLLGVWLNEVSGHVVVGVRRSDRRFFEL